MANMKLLFFFLTGVHYVYCIDVHCANDDPFKTFRCPDGTFISDRLICDGIEHCSEGFDEKFPECKEGLHIGYEVNSIDDCSPDEEKFLCRDYSRCLDIINKCDGFCNCFDCSDEHDNCSNSEKNSIDAENIDCTSSEICDQKADHFNDRDRANMTKCCLLNDNVAKKNLLLYSVGKRTIKALYISNSTNDEEFIVKEVANDCTALTAAGDYIYYATDESTWFSMQFETDEDEYDYDTMRTDKHIFKFSMISHETFKIIKSDDEVTSISVDYITNNIYYTTSSTLSVCSNCGRLCQQLKSHDLINSIRLAPKLGLMFWISSQQKDKNYDYYLMKSSMDGLNEKQLIRADGLSWELISVDELNEKLYIYCKNSQQIKSVTFDGDKLEVYWSFYSPIYSATIFKKDVFFINEQQTKISRIDKTNKSSTIKSTGTINELFVYNPLLQHTKVRNPCPLSCIGLCLTRPSSTRGILNYMCLHQTNSEEILQEKREKKVLIILSLIVVLCLMIKLVTLVAKYCKLRYLSFDFF